MLNKYRLIGLVDRVTKGVKVGANVLSLEDCRNSCKMNRNGNNRRHGACCLIPYGIQIIVYRQGRRETNIFA